MGDISPLYLAAGGVAVVLMFLAANKLGEKEAKEPRAGDWVTLRVEDRFVVARIEERRGETFRVALTSCGSDQRPDQDTFFEAKARGEVSQSASAAWMTGDELEASDMLVLAERKSWISVLAGQPWT